MFLVATVMCGSAFGETVGWDGLGGSNWSDDSWYNYDAAARLAPTAADYVLAGGVITLDIAASVSDIQVGPGGSVGSLDMQNDLTVSASLLVGLGVPSVPLDGTGTIHLNTASTLTASYVSLGFDTGGTGVLNMSDGTFNAPGNFVVGAYMAAVGTINMTGGAINTPYLGIGNGDGSTATLDLLGGTITTDNLYVGDGAAGVGTGTITLGGTGKMILTNTVLTPDVWKTIFDPMIGTRILDAQTNIVGDTLEITADPGATFVPYQIESFDDFASSGWIDASNFGVVIQDDPNDDGPVEGASCLRVKFEDIAPDWDNVVLKNFASLDITQDGDPNNPGTALSFWVWSDLVGSSRVHQLIVNDPTGRIGRFDVPAASEVGWRQVVAPLSEFYFNTDWGDSGPVDLTDISAITFWFSSYNLRGNSIYVDDLWLEAYVEPEPEQLPIQIASFDDFAADGWYDDYVVALLHDQWLFQEDPNDGPAEGTGCVRVKFELWDGESVYMNSDIMKIFTPSIDLLRDGDPNDPGTALSFQYWPDVVGDGRVLLIVIANSTFTAYESIVIPRATEPGWQKVTAPLRDFAPHWGDVLDLTNIGMIQIVCVSDPGGGNSIYVDDLRLEEAEPDDPCTEAALTEADYGTIAVDGDPSDWASLASDVVTFDPQQQPTPDDNGDLIVDYRLAWDNDYLYVLIEEQPADGEAVEATGLESGDRALNDGLGGDVLYDSLALLFDFDDDGMSGTNFDLWLFLGLSSNDSNDVMMTWTNSNWGPHDPLAVANGSVQTSGTLGSRVTEARLSWADIENALDDQSKPGGGLLNAVGPGFMFGADPRLNDLEGDWASDGPSDGGAWFNGELWTQPSGSDVFSVDVTLVIGNCEAVKANGYKLAGDVDGNCRIDVGDAAIMAGEWLTSGVLADIVDDDNVDLADFAQIGLEWMQCNDPTDMSCTVNWPEYVPCQL